MLTTGKSGTGTGTITSTPPGIACGNDCTETYPSGTVVTLTATPAAGSTFSGWSGACTGTGLCMVTLDAAKKVTATFKPVPFVAITTGVVDGKITTPIATVTTTATIKTDDVGKKGSFFITAWISSGALGTVVPIAPLGLTDTLTVKRANGLIESLSMSVLAETTGAYVLVQLTESGWKPVVNGQLIPYTSGVLGEQTAAVSILNNASTAGLTGAQFCVGYGTGETATASAQEMMQSGKFQVIASVPETAGTAAAAGSCLVATPQTGIWWNPSESGRGFVIETSGNNLFFGTFLYEASATPETARSTWYQAGGAMNGDLSFSGTLSEMAGGQTLNGAYRPATLRSQPGTVQLRCTTPSTCGLTWQGGQVGLERFQFDATATPSTAPETGIWWNPAESGRGFLLEQQGGSLFGGAFMYDESGNPVWYSTSGAIGASTYQGTLLQFAGGQSMTGSYRAPTYTPIGPVSVQFQDKTRAVMTLPGGTQVNLERFRF